MTENTEPSKRALKKARGIARAAKREDTGACKCQTVTIVPSTHGYTFRYVVGRTRTIKTDCKHWLIVDEHTGRLTDSQVNPRIGGQPRYGVGRASHHAMRSPWNKQGPLS